MGQRNSVGVSPGLLCCGIVVAEAERWWWKENHLCLPVSPIWRDRELEEENEQQSEEESEKLLWL